MLVYLLWIGFRPFRLFRLIFRLSEYFPSCFRPPKHEIRLHFTRKLCWKSRTDLIIFQSKYDLLPFQSKKYFATSASLGSDSISTDRDICSTTNPIFNWVISWETINVVQLGRITSMSIHSKLKAFRENLKHKRCGTNVWVQGTVFKFRKYQDRSSAKHAPHRSRKKSENLWARLRLWYLEFYFEFSCREWNLERLINFFGQATLSPCARTGISKRKC